MAIYVPQELQEKRWFAEWVKARIPYSNFLDGMYECMVSVRNSEIAGVAVFHDYRKPDIVISLAADSPYWASRSFLLAMGLYCYEQLSCRRITAYCNRSNKRIRKFLKGMGFVEEGKLRHAAPNGADIMICSLLKEEFYVQKRFTRAARAAQHGRHQSANADAGADQPHQSSYPVRVSTVLQ